ncbi:MAG: type II secretion system protein N [Sphingobium sp.]|nr:PDZ domain-containing protein [Sphingobium sp.]MCP5400210.1 PDZ domain-containing protein [Sphingomonas sp.]
MKGFGWPRTIAWPRLLELAMIALLVVQLVRLAWTIVTPLGPMGEWRGRQAELLPASARAQLFQSFDAFFPAPVQSGGPQNVTSLALTLYGVRINEGSGLGSAIIGGADGEQGSYAVGDEIQPGVTLKSVAFDHVVIDRSGVEESIFLDQSEPVTPVAPPAPNVAPSQDASASSGPREGVSVDVIKAGVGFGARMSDGRITGLLVTPKGPGFQQAGFREGDVITQVNGKSIASAGDASILQQALTPGARISLMVERGADVVPIVITVQK